MQTQRLLIKSKYSATGDTCLSSQDVGLLPGVALHWTFCSEVSRNLIKIARALEPLVIHFVTALARVVNAPRRGVEKQAIDEEILKKYEQN